MSENRLSEIDFHAPKAKINRRYTSFVKAMRLLLPLSALALTIIVITWPETDNKIIAIDERSLIPNTDLAKNELLNPKFESIDKDLNPYTVTATRALQNQENANLLKLENPNGNMILKDGQALYVDAINGTYEQEEEKLFLEKDVTLKHQSGYVLTTQELRIDLKNGQAFSDKDVEITGIDGHIKAKGLDGDTNTEVLIFKGPATLTLTPSAPPKKNEEDNNDL
ncbi:MAG: LPS export ABC transporter periplasmic protein LptC [Alphaproteobacteria bacterium]|nr:LPS export ABC transporter periplasmic protein LptC [Alphaproteobacteria bacterium]NCQ88596.1 LPS export ABC transporter periplasmic protein LptC [Alphaproteobacteria bacterium]NCT06139.1 LPS export ABC transporter periplasmic protein LptC [Alphaproteobacteria bacterium]